MTRRLAQPLITVLLLLVAALCLPFGATAAPPPVDAPAAARDARPDPGFGPDAQAAALRRARDLAPAVAQDLGLSRNQKLVPRGVERDADGTLHLRYDRTVGGLAVVGGDLVVHRAPTGDLEGADFATQQSLAAVPTSHPQVAAARATRVTAARIELSAGTVGDSELVVWAVTGVPRLAWQVQVEGADPHGAPVRRVEYVDATSGRHIAGWSLHQEADGDGRSLYSGKVPLKTVRVRGKYLLRDTTRGNAVTVDVGNRTDPKCCYLPGTVFKDADNHWGNGAQSSRQSAAADVAYGTAKTWDYFKNTFNRAGIRGDGKGAKSRVHYGQNFDNAFWDDACFCMTYGDGGTLFKPLVSLDVAGHEMTHGITSNTAGLIYFGESGGLNEATSDIFGAMVEFSARRAADPGDYYIGEKIAKPGLGRPFLRRMDQPGADGVSYNCWTLNMGTDDVHHTSGPANKFFYLLAEGTGTKTIGGRAHSGTSCTGSTFAGIGRNTAAAIWWRALSRYMTSTTSYIDARDATIRAARDLGTSCAAVVRAWNAVSVPAGYWNCGGRLDEGASVLGANPGFESGSSGWGLSGTALVTDDPAVGFPHSGTRWANLNGRGLPNTATLTRAVTVPATSTAHLRFEMLVYSEESPVGEFDTFDILVNGAPIGPAGHWSNLHANNTYLRWDVPLGSFAGQSVTLGFRGVEDTSVTTQFLVDDVTLTPR